MDHKMIAFCGAYCGACEWKDKTGCKGCQECQGHLFWGECEKAKCCIERGAAHCGECPDLPCQKLLDLYNDPEHGDHGARLRNLKNWAAGNYEFETLGNLSQENARNT